MDNEEKRLLRQKRRRKNRIIAFVALFVICAIIGVAIFFGSKVVINKMATKNVETEAVEEPEPTPEQAVVDFTPQIEDEEEQPEVSEEVIAEPTPEATEEDLLDEMVDNMISQMSLEDKVAGLFIVSPEALTGQNNVTSAGDGTKASLETYAVGGIIYSKANIKSDSQLKEMIDTTRSYSRYPLFISISEEGGEVAPLQSTLKLEKTSTAKALGDGLDDTATREQYAKIGSYLKENGFDVDFAPVAEVSTKSTTKILGNTSFGDNAQVVASNVYAAVQGLKEANVVSCVKHFPGQGYVDGDTHVSMTSTSRTRFEMEESELVPFKAAIDAGVDMIMVGHFSAPELTEDNMPCSMSKAVMTDMLRDEIGFDGVIITDEMNLAAISEYYSSDEAAVRALKGGADMILMPENFQQAYEGVINAVKDGAIDERRINDSLARVYKLKYRDVLQHE